MSSMTFGPPFVLDGPLPVAPPHSLLTAPGVLVMDAGGSRWMNGVAVYGYPNQLPDVWDPCSGEGSYEVKSDDSSFPTPDFAAFAAYLPITCSSFTIAGDPEAFARRAEVALDARISYSIEAALASGIPMSANPFLADANVQVLAAGAAVTPEVGLAYLEEAIGGTGISGMIHTTPGPASRWFTSFPVPEPYTSIYTAIGTPVAVGGGYAGATPFGESAAGDGESWTFATGQVRVHMAEETTLNIEDVLDRSINDVTFRAERYAVVDWDTSLQAAVLIDWAA